MKKCATCNEHNGFLLQRKLKKIQMKRPLSGAQTMAEGEKEYGKEIRKSGC